MEPFERFPRSQRYFIRPAAWPQRNPTAQHHTLEFNPVACASCGELTQVSLNGFLDQLSHIELKLNNREWGHLTELILLLDPFAEATDRTEGDKVKFHHTFSVKVACENLLIR